MSLNDMPLNDMSLNNMPLNRRSRCARSCRIAVLAAIVIGVSSSNTSAVANYAPEENRDQSWNTPTQLRSQTPTRRHWNRWNNDWDRRWQRNWANSWASWDNDLPARGACGNVCGNKTTGQNSARVPEQSTKCTGVLQDPGRDIPNFHEVHTFLFRGGQPTERGLDSLKDMGVRTIVDLRSDPQQTESERQLCEHHDLKFINIPLVKTASPSNQDISRFMDVVGRARENPDKGAVFVHDHLGADRTGCAIGAYRILADKYPYERAYSEMLQYGFHNNYVKLAQSVQRLDSNAKAPAARSAQPIHKHATSASIRKKPAAHQ